MTVGQNSFKIVPLLLLFYINYAPITCQNCGLPNLIRVSELLKESSERGKLILRTPVRNVVSISKVVQIPDGFVNAILEPTYGSEHETQLELLVLISKPLWKPNGNAISVIDDLRLGEINITLELGCSDGQVKLVKIVIPIKDENTECPKFNEEDYALTTERCTLERCVLTFNKEIIVIDKDRDKENADTVLWTDRPDMVNFLHNFSIDESWYGNNHYGGKSEKGYQSKLQIEYVPHGDHHSEEDSIHFKMFANNTKLSANGTVMLAVASVTVRFEENSHRLSKPEFEREIYYVTLHSGDILYSEPEKVSAYVKGLSDQSTTHIQYRIQGAPEILGIDKDGTLRILEGVDVAKIVYDIPSATKVLNYKIIAERIGAGGNGMMTARSDVPLIVMFADYPQCSSTPWPELSSTTTTSTISTTTMMPPSTTPPFTTTTPTSATPPFTTTTHASTTPPFTTTTPTSTTPPFTTTTHTSTTPPFTTTTHTSTTPPFTTTSHTSSTPPFTTTTHTSTIPPFTTTTPTSATPPFTTTTHASTTPPFTTTTPTSATPPFTTTTPTSATTSMSTTTSSTPTTEEQQSTSDSTDYVTTQTSPFPTSPDPTSTSENTYPNSTSSPVFPTTEITPSPPDDCTCDCLRFTCHSPQVAPSLNTSERIYYRDPYQCSIYHICPTSNESVFLHSGRTTTYQCPDETVFCSKMAACTTVEMCMIANFPNRPFPPLSARGYDYDPPNVGDSEKCQNCTCRDISIPPDHENNTCTNENHEKNNPDRTYADIFHKCQRTVNPDKYYDYPMRCSAGLVFCANTGECGYHDDDDCQFNIESTFLQCDVCEMGDWVGFNIFTKTFDK